MKGRSQGKWRAARRDKRVRGGPPETWRLGGPPWGRTFSGRGSSRCEGPQIIQDLAHVGNYQKVSVLGTRAREEADGGSRVGLLNLVNPDILDHNILLRGAVLCTREWLAASLGSTH